MEHSERVKTLVNDELIYYGSHFQDEHSIYLTSTSCSNCDRFSLYCEYCDFYLLECLCKGISNTTNKGISNTTTKQRAML